MSLAATRYIAFKTSTSGESLDGEHVTESSSGFRTRIVCRLPGQPSTYSWYSVLATPPILADRSVLERRCQSAGSVWQDWRMCTLRQPRSTTVPSSPDELRPQWREDTDPSQSVSHLLAAPLSGAVRGLAESRIRRHPRQGRGGHMRVFDVRPIVDRLASFPCRHVLHELGASSSRLRTAMRSGGVDCSTCHAVC